MNAKLFSQRPAPLISGDSFFSPVILRRSAIDTRKANGVPPVVHDVLRSPGQTLPAPARAALEPRFGQDFSQVRVHTDARAADSARAVNALAYTVGRDVVFGQGQFAPQTSSGQRLLAHELTHVVQQAGATSTGNLRIGDPNDRAEQLAEHVSGQVASGGQPSQSLVAGSSAPAIQRQPVLTGSGGEDARISRLSAGMAGSATIDGFELGKADLTEAHKKEIAQEAARLEQLLKEYPDSFINVVGHTDAVGAEEHNKELGQQRADAVLAELVADGIPAEAMRAASLGETSLRIKTDQPEPRNRRVEINLTARNFFRRGFDLKPTPDLKDIPNFKLPPRPPIFTPNPGPDPAPDYFKPIPPAPPTSDPIEDALNRDKLLRALPDFLRDPIKNALKRGDESLAEKAIDSSNMDGQAKNAIKAAVKALLRTLRGEKWTPPVPPLYELPPSIMPENPKAPGEKIFPIFSTDWDFPTKKRK